MPTCTPAFVFNVCLCVNRQACPGSCSSATAVMAQDDDTVKIQFDEGDHEPGRIVGTIVRKRRQEMWHNPQPGDSHPLSKPNN
jgi:hypothetical protein